MKRARLFDLFRPSFEWMRQMTVRNQVKTPMVSLSFNDMEPQTLAAQLTYLEWKVLRKITFTNYKTYAIKNTLQDNPRLERSIQFFNGLSTWIQCMVLNKTTPQERAEIIHKFLDVAKVSSTKRRFSGERWISLLLASESTAEFQYMLGRDRWHIP